MDNIIKGYCPYVSGSKSQAVDDALDMNIFPDSIRDLFNRAFSYDATTAIKQSTIDKRPSAQEWRIALGKLYQEGVNICRKNKLHEYPKSYLKDCPWCAIEKRKQLSGNSTHVQNHVFNPIFQINSNTVATNVTQQPNQSTAYVNSNNRNKQFKKMVGFGVAIIILLVMIISVIASIENANYQRYEAEILSPTEEPAIGQW